MGLMSALFIGLLIAFVWGRDRNCEMLDVVNSRPVTSWQYVLGKYLGVVLTWGILVLLVVALGVGRTYQLARQFHLPFAWHDFTFPVVAWMWVSLLYGTAFVLAVSLLLRSSVGTLLVHLFYWAYSVMQLTMFQIASKSRFLSYWFFRFDAGMKPGTYTLIQRRQGDVLLNRLFYLGMTMTILVLVVLVFQRLRERGTLLRAVGMSEQQPQSWWRHLLHKLRVN
jgi:ABC-type transport system involved in multi-copper enzyme maturation permease subunit